MHNTGRSRRGALLIPNPRGSGLAITHLSRRPLTPWRSYHQPHPIPLPFFSQQKTAGLSPSGSFFLCPTLLLKLPKDSWGRP